MQFVYFLLGAAERTVEDQPPAPDAQLLFVTGDAFQIEGRGCVLTPGIHRDYTPFPRGGSPLMLRRPDGSILPCQIVASELISRSRSASVPILLSPLVHKSEVPVGTEVWLVRSTPSV